MRALARFTIYGLRFTSHFSRFAFHASRFTLRVSRLSCCLAFALVPFANVTRAAAVDLNKLPPAATNRIDYTRDIQPILEASCLKCHGPEKPKSGFRINSREPLLRGGENGKDVIPGDSAQSPLIHYVAGLVEDMQMPPKGKGEPLTPAQIGLLRAWIDQGVSWSEIAPAPRTVMEVAPTLRWVGVEGNEQKFRSLEWFKEGWNGGAENFLLEQQIGRDSKLTITGHALVDDYAVTLNLKKADRAYVNAGWQQYRKWFNDLGGFYQPFNPSIYSLGEDLHLDIGKAWLNAGVTLPEGTQVITGYEYTYRNGQKSSTEWLPVTQQPNGPTRAIVPNAKDVDEHMNSFLFGLTHNWDRANVQDNFRFDFYDLGTTRKSVVDATDSTNLPLQIKEATDLQSLVNALKFQVQPKEWLLLSGGYLYTHQDGDSSFRLTPTEATSSLPASGTFINAPTISLEQSANVLNANAQVTPWEALDFSGGVQIEWNQESTFGPVTYDELDLTVPSMPVTNLMVTGVKQSDINRFITDEQFRLRFTKIPYTIIYGDVRFRQESYDRSDSSALNGNAYGDNFDRDTDSNLNTYQYRGGFNVSPWTRVALNAFYLHRDQKNNYDADATLGGTPVVGNYPGFIQAWDITTDEVGVKLTLRPVSWLKTTLACSLIGTEFKITSPMYLVPSPQGGNITVPAGTVQAGDSDAQVYSINATINPWRRLYLFTTFSFADTRTTTADNHDPAIVAYAGQTYSVLATATYLVNEKTDLLISYTFCDADYTQNNVTAGLPLGIDYQWHQLRAGIARQLFGKVSTRLDYVWYFYREPSSGNFNNFTGNGVFATVFLRWP
jgi:hypothetical protein